MQNVPLRFVCSFSLALALAACAAAQSIAPAPLGDPSATAPGGPTTVPTASPSASNDAPANAAEPSAHADSGIVTPATNSVVVRVLAGLTPPNPPGRACAYNALYTLNLKTHELSWDFCFVSENDKRTLRPREVATVDAALARLEVVEGSGLCPIHAPTISVTTRDGDVTREYHADLCGAAPPVLAVDATDGLVQALYKLAGK